MTSEATASPGPIPDPHSSTGLIRAGSLERVKRFARFGAVGASGFVVNELALGFFVAVFDVHYLVGAVLATQVSTLWNFALVELWAFREVDAKRSAARRLLLFFLLNNAALLLRGPILVVLTDVAGLNYLVSNLVSLGALTLVRFTISDSWIWASHRGDEHVVDLGDPDDGADAWTEIAGEVAIATVPGAELMEGVEPPGELPRRRFVRVPHRQPSSMTAATGAGGRIGSASGALLTVAPAPSGAEADAAADAEATAEGDAQPERSTPRMPRWVLPAGIAVVALAVRLWNLDRIGFNSDEVVYSSQAALLAGKSHYEQLFTLFRAHPLLFQSLLSVVYRVSMSDYLARLLSALFGLGTVAVCFWAARSLYGRRVALVAAAIVAVMPYSVIVTRQVLLDGPMVFFATLALGLMARFVETRRSEWLYATSVALGLTFLTKETGILVAVAVYTFVVLTPQVRIRARELAISLAILGSLLVVFPLAVALGKQSKTGGEFFLWQVLRRPNHGFAFYFDHVPTALGLGVVAVALVGLWVLRHDRSWRESLLLCWILVPTTFFLLWPVKGYQYLLPIAPAVAILAARGLAALPTKGWISGKRWRVPAVLVTGVVGAVVAATLLIPTWTAIRPTTDPTVDAGAGGVPGGREAGEWIGASAPIGAKVVTIGPSMSNLVRYFGARESFGLSVSPNPLHRNPVYEPVGNADLRLRRGEIQYLVWDATSASRSPRFASKLVELAGKYHGHVVHRERVGGRDAIVVYQVRP